MAKKKKKPNLSQAVKNVGKVLTQKESQQVAKQTGKSVQQVMAKAVNAGVGLGSKVVNNYTPAPGQTPAVYKALAPLANLQMNKGTVYTGYSTTQTPSTQTRALGGGVNYTPGSTTYNPIVLPRSVVSGVQRVTTGDGNGKVDKDKDKDGGDGAVNKWEDSVNTSNQALIDSINAQIAANATQAELYMGQIDSLMQAMQQQAMNPNGGLQSFTPYAVTTNVAPAAGAQTTQAITARKKPAVTDLTLNPLVMADAGTGLNIGI
jgi:hypothetical protein